MNKKKFGFRPFSNGIPIKGFLILCLIFSLISPSLIFAETYRDLELEVSTASLEAQILAYVNAERQSRGLAPLLRDADLKLHTRIRAQELSYYFAHRKPEGRSPFADCPRAYLGENIQQNYLRVDGSSTALSIFQVFRSSGAHWSNMLNPDWQRTSISVYLGKPLPLDAYHYYTPVFICQWFAD